MRLVEETVKRVNNGQNSFTRLDQTFYYDSKEEKDARRGLMQQREFRTIGPVRINIGSKQEPFWIWIGSYYKYVNIVELLSIKAKSAAATDKSDDFIWCIKLLELCILHKIIYKDPNNENNALVYYSAGNSPEENPEGWYSVNIMHLASDLVNDREG